MYNSRMQNLCYKDYSSYKSSGHGCHVWNMYTGCLAYDDDIMLLSPTQGALHEMLKVSEQYSADYNMVFNATKSKLIAFGKSFIAKSVTCVSFQGNSISQVQSKKRVGNLMGNHRKIPQQRVSQACSTLTGQFNLLSRIFGF